MILTIIPTMIYIYIYKDYYNKEYKSIIKTLSYIIVLHNVSIIDKNTATIIERDKIFRTVEEHMSGDSSAFM